MLCYLARPLHCHLGNLIQRTQPVSIYKILKSNKNTESFRNHLKMTKIYSKFYVYWFIEKKYGKFLKSPNLLLLETYLVTLKKGQNFYNGYRMTNQIGLIIVSKIQVSKTHPQLSRYQPRNQIWEYWRPESITDERRANCSQTTGERLALTVTRYVLGRLALLALAKGGENSKVHFWFFYFYLCKPLRPCALT